MRKLYIYIHASRLVLWKAYTGQEIDPVVISRIAILETTWKSVLEKDGVIKMY